MAYVRSVVKYGLSVEKGTERVPDDGNYHLLVDGEVVLSTPVEALALIEMEEAKAARRQGSSATAARDRREGCPGFPYRQLCGEAEGATGKGRRGIGRGKG